MHHRKFIHNISGFPIPFPLPSVPLPLLIYLSFVSFLSSFPFISFSFPSLPPSFLFPLKQKLF